MGSESPAGGLRRPPNCRQALQSSTQVEARLGLLEEAGLIKRVSPADDATRKVFYNPVPSIYWTWCLEASENAAEMLGRKARY